MMFMASFLSVVLVLSSIPVWNIANDEWVTRSTAIPELPEAPERRSLPQIKQDHKAQLNTKACWKQITKDVRRKKKLQP